MSTTPILRAQNVCRNYGAIKVLKDVTLSLQPGERHVVIGPNGAGKSTLFKVMSGELPPTSGQILFEGQDVSGLKGHSRVMAGVGRSFQVARIFTDLTAFDNVLIAVEARDRRARGGLSLPRLRASGGHIAEARDLLDRLGIAALHDTEGRFLSHGDRKRLELAMILALRPRILMLDEPTAGMSSTDRAQAVEQILSLATREGLTLFLTEHDMSVVFQLGTRLSVLNFGQLIKTGEPELVRADPMVREIYLGRSASHA